MNKEKEKTNTEYLLPNKRDIILIIIILLLSLCTFIAYKYFHKTPGSYVQISINNKIFKELPLDKNTNLTIHGENNGTNILEIKNGYADIIDADCPDKLCVKQKKIKHNGETLVCLPHKVVITIISDKKSKLDGVSY